MPPHIFQNQRSLRGNLHEPPNYVYHPYTSAQKVDTLSQTVNFLHTATSGNLMITGHVLGQTTRILLDTGSDSSTIQAALLPPDIKLHQIEPIPTRGMYGGSYIETEAVELPITLFGRNTQHQSIETSFTVMATVDRKTNDIKPDLLIGVDVLRELKASIDFATCTMTIYDGAVIPLTRSNDLRGRKRLLPNRAVLEREWK